MCRHVFALVIAICAIAVFAINAQESQKKGYILAQIDVTNPTQYAEYAKLSPGIIEKFGGRFLARGGKTETLEGAAGKSRVVVIEFPSYDKAKQFYNSLDYQAARKVRAGAATVQFVLVEGM